MISDSLRPELAWAVAAAQNKKADAVTVLDLTGIGAFTDYFLICSGESARQIQAITDEIEEQLGRRGVAPMHREGGETAEWVLLDYGDFVIHVFSQRARLFYDLERLWRAARRFDFAENAPAGAAEP